MDAISYAKASSAYKLASLANAGLVDKANMEGSSILVPVGTTATRPVLGAGESALRYNSDAGGLEEWTGTEWKNVSAAISAVSLQGKDTEANILTKVGMVAEDLWIASDTLEGWVYDGSVWLNVGPLEGPQGDMGISAYQVAVNNGFVGTQIEWLESLIGAQGLPGNGIASVTKTGTVGLVDTYTITFTNSTTTEFNVTNGVAGLDIDHVSKTSGISAPGTTDIYTVWGDVGETINLGTFNVYNGANGAVISVAGKSGDVVLFPVDVGLSNVDNTSDANKPVSTAQATAIELKADSLNPTITGLKEVSVAIGANCIDLSLGNHFTKTISGATTFTVSNVATSGTVNSFILELTNAGSATITWFSGVKWASGTAPTLTTSGVDILGFYTKDGGTTYRGLVLAKDSK